MMPFPDSEECLSALLDAFARAAEPGGAAAPSSAGHVNGHAGKPAAGHTAQAAQEEQPPPWSSPEEQARQHVRTALDGVDFLTHMHVSATLSGRGFLACCKDRGIEPHALALAQRCTLDDRMGAHFRQAADAGGITRPETAEALLRSWLVELKAG